MSQANSPNTPILSRCAALADIASTAALPITAGIPTTATATADPIFDVIEAHRKAQAAVGTTRQKAEAVSAFQKSYAVGLEISCSGGACY